MKNKMNWIGLMPIFASLSMLLMIIYSKPADNFQSKLLFKFIPVPMMILLFVYGLGVLGLISFKGYNDVVISATNKSR